MSSRSYWREREAEALQQRIADEEEYDKKIVEIYKDMLDATQKEIEAFYGKYADKEGITIADAKKRVSKVDIEAYKRKAQRYVEAADCDRKTKGETDPDAEYFSETADEEMRLYNLTMKVNRLELLKANIGLELAKGHAELESYMGEILQGRTMDELERQAGILGQTIKSNAKKVHAIVNASFHNATYSDRIWMHQDLLKNDLAKLLQSGLIQGKNPRELARELKKKFDVKASDAERLMRTELARVQTEAQKQSFERNDYEEYEFIVNSNCCPICAALDGKHFKVEDMMPGENAPPMHPNCRCSIAAYEDSEEYGAWLDYLDKGGTTEEWKKLKVSKKQTGGKHYEPYNKDDAKDVEAAKAYRKISRRNDIKTIADNSGFSEKDIKQIKRHIFYNKHKTYNGYEMLYPDYDMAVAWNRLYEGKQLERDILLLHHELLESTLEKEYNLTISEAHRQATKKYDWATVLDAELGEKGEPDGLL